MRMRKRMWVKLFSSGGIQACVVANIFQPGHLRPSSWAISVSTAIYQVHSHTFLSGDPAKESWSSIGPVTTVQLKLNFIIIKLLL